MPTAEQRFVSFPNKYGPYVTLSYHAGAIIANMSDPDGKTTELIYISPTNIWINGQRVAFETEEVEVA